MRLLYFAWVREKIGTSSEDLPKPYEVNTVQELINYLIGLGGGYHGAFHDMSRIRIAINQDFVKIDHPLDDGDEVAFFPPVTGG
jgi:molybdopterin synthase sulfur carrier subunit